MKKILVSFLMVMALCSYGYAGVLAGDTTNNISTATAISAPVNTNVNTNANTNLNTNLNTQGQMQGQGQLQGQLQGQNQTAVGRVSTKVKNSVSNDTSINTPREAIYVPAINLPSAPVIIGEVAKYTLLPKFANTALKPYGGEPVISVLFASYGNVFSRITVDELTSFLIENGKAFEGRKDVRYEVICKKASHGLALGTGGAGATTNYDGNISGGGVLGASGSFAVADPYCFVEFYEVILK